MNLFSRAPTCAIGLSVDGLSVKAAYLRSERGRVILAGLESVQLKTRFGAGGEEEGAPAAPSADDILGLAPSPAAQSPTVDQAPKEEAEEETNSSVLYGLLNRFPVAESVLAIGLMEASVALFDVKGAGGLKPKQVRRATLERVAQARGGTEPPEDRVDSIQTGRGDVFALVHEDPLELLGLLDQLRPFYGRVQVGLIDANEVSLINMVRCGAPPEGEVSVVVYVGEDFSRAIFLRGGDYVGMTQAISEGVRSPQVLNTLFSRILLEQDTSRIPDVGRVLLAGGAREVGAQAFFAGQFPEARVDYLAPAGLDLKQLDAQRKERIPEFDIPIGLAWKALEPGRPGFHPTNFLSQERKRLQNPLEIAWHGLVLIAVIAATTLLMGMRLWDQARSITAVRRSIHLKEREIRENTVYVGLVDSLQNQVDWYKRSLSVTDTLSSHYRAWSPLLRSMTEASRRVNSIWFTGLATEKERLILSGKSLYRDRVPAVARLLGGSLVRKIARSQVRSREVYDFEIEVEGFTALSQDTLSAAPADMLLTESDPEPEPDQQASREGVTGDPEDAGGAGGQEISYIVHVGVFEDREGAERRVEDLKAKGFSAVFTEGRATPWGRFQVHIGPFRNPQEARDARDQLNRTGGPQAWIYRRTGD